MVYIPSTSVYLVIAFSSFISGFCTGVSGAGAAIILQVTWALSQTLLGLDLTEGDPASATRRVLAMTAIYGIIMYPPMLAKMSRNPHFHVPTAVMIALTASGLSWLGTLMATTLKTTTLSLALAVVLILVAAVMFLQDQRAVVKQRLLRAQAGRVRAGRGSSISGHGQGLRSSSRSIGGGVGEGGGELGSKDNGHPLTSIELVNPRSIRVPDDINSSNINNSTHSGGRTADVTIDLPFSPLPTLPAEADPAAVAVAAVGVGDGADDSISVPDVEADAHVLVRFHDYTSPSVRTEDDAGNANSIGNSSVFPAAAAAAPVSASKAMPSPSPAEEDYKTPANYPDEYKKNYNREYKKKYVASPTLELNDELPSSFTEVDLNDADACAGAEAEEEAEDSPCSGGGLRVVSLSQALAMDRHGHLRSDAGVGGESAGGDDGAETGPWYKRLVMFYVHHPRQTVALMLVGIASGLLGGIFGISGPPIFLYLSTRSFGPTALRDTCTLTFVMFSPMLLAARIKYKVLVLDDIVFYAVGGVAVAVGVTVGWLLHPYCSARAVRGVLFLATALASLSLTMANSSAPTAAIVGGYVAAGLVTASVALAMRWKANKDIKQQ
jgi:uncharacterized membrane protein YfcA